MPKQVPKGKEILYTYIPEGTKNKLFKIGEKKGLDLTSMVNLIISEYIEIYEARKSNKFR